MPPNETTLPPVVIDLGKERRKKLKELGQGRGKLATQVAQVVEQVRGQLGEQAHGKEFIPVVVIFQKKRKKRRRPALPLSCVF
jgi:hypothetical protein